MEPKLVDIGLGDDLLEERTVATQVPSDQRVLDLPPRELRRSARPSDGQTGAVDKALREFRQITSEAIPGRRDSQRRLPGDELRQRRPGILPRPVDRQRRVERREASERGQPGSHLQEKHLRIQRRRLRKINPHRAPRRLSLLREEQALQLSAQARLPDPAVTVERQNIAPLGGEVMDQIRLRRDPFPQLSGLAVERLPLRHPIGEHVLRRHPNSAEPSRPDLVPDPHSTIPPQRPAPCGTPLHSLVRIRARRCQISNTTPQRNEPPTLLPRRPRGVCLDVEHDRLLCRCPWPGIWPGRGGEVLVRPGCWPDFLVRREAVGSPPSVVPRAGRRPASLQHRAELSAYARDGLARSSDAADPHTKVDQVKDLGKRARLEPWTDSSGRYSRRPVWFSSKEDPGSCRRG